MTQQPPPQEAAQVLGLHLEGPCLNPQKRGAHPQEFLLPLSSETLEQVIGPFSNTVRLMTLAPELDPSGEAIRPLTVSGNSRQSGPFPRQRRSSESSL